MSCDVKIICACKINHLVYFPFIGSLLSQVVILVENVENEIILPIKKIYSLC